MMKYSSNSLGAYLFSRGSRGRWKWWFTRHKMGYTTESYEFYKEKPTWFSWQDAHLHWLIRSQRKNSIHVLSNMTSNGGGQNANGLCGKPFDKPTWNIFFPHDHLHQCIYIYTRTRSSCSPSREREREKEREGKRGREIIQIEREREIIQMYDMKRKEM